MSTRSFLFLLASARPGGNTELLGRASRPGQVLEDEEALVRAKGFFAQETPFARF